jgi:hypothetical protein
MRYRNYIEYQDLHLCQTFGSTMNFWPVFDSKCCELKKVYDFATAYLEDSVHINLAMEKKGFVHNSNDSATKMTQDAAENN